MGKHKILELLKRFLFGARAPIEKKRPIYVLDTNVLIDYPDLIPNGKVVVLRDSTIDLTGAHIIVPTAVSRELDSFKKERSERGRTARMLLKRIKKLRANTTTGKLLDSYYLRQPTYIKDRDQLFSVMPIYKNFSANLPFQPSDDDMDGQIILTTMAAACLDLGIPIDGTADPNTLDFSPSNVTLLTNDNNMTTRANERGVKTDRYGYRLPLPYTGRRDLLVPAELLESFVNGAYDCVIELDEWQEAMPDEPELIANEFIVMNNPDANVDLEAAKWRNIGRYDADNHCIVHLKYLKGGPDIMVKNAGQAIYLEALRDPNIAMVICTGPAGTGKTFIAALYALWACRKGFFIGTAVVPCRTENNYGYLPGDLNEKLDPAVQPIKNAIRNNLLHTKYKQRLEQIKKYGPTDGPSNEENDESISKDKKSIRNSVEEEADEIFENWFGQPIPIEEARGRSFEQMIALYDEFQDQNDIQADTLITRLGDDGKIVLTGDVEQIHAAYLDKGNNGLVFAIEEAKDDPAVAIVHFNPDEVVRHSLIRRIMERRQKRHNKSVLIQKALIDGDEEAVEALTDSSDNNPTD